MSWEQNVRKVQPYIAGEQPRQREVIKLNTNECPYPPSPEVARAAAKMDCDKFRLYPDMNAEKLVHALADYYDRKPEQIFVGVGSDDVLALCFMTFFNGEKPILFPNITYSFYEVWAELYGLSYQTCPLDKQFRLRKEDYLQENGGIIIPNPNAPTGVLEEGSVLEEIVAANRDSVVIIDEAYIDFGGSTILPLIECYDNLLVVQTFSKSRAMAGIRVGYAFGNEKLIGYLKDVKFSFNSYTLNMAAIELGEAALKDDAYFREVTGKIIETREWSKKRLAELGFFFTDSKSNFLFAAHGKIPAKELFEALKAENIYVRYWNKPGIENYLRITVGTQEQMEHLVNFLKKYIENRMENAL